jgi:hypothetical protein
MAPTRALHFCVPQICVPRSGQDGPDYLVSLRLNPYRQASLAIRVGSSVRSKNRILKDSVFPNGLTRRTR